MVRRASSGRSWRVRPHVRWALALSFLIALMTACGAAPPQVGRSGIDGLAIPTSSPDPADFVSAVDNRWLPLKTGSTWTYQVTTSERTGGPVRAEVSVGSHRVQIAGVATTEVRTRVLDRTGRVARSTTGWYAQDLSGNVWLFGQDVEDGSATPTRWRAGVDAAEAGLAMAATPRVGDGYLLGRAVGVPAERARVISIRDLRDTPYAEFEDLVAIKRTTGDLAGSDRREWYAAGVGMVATQGTGPTGFEEWVLTDFRGPEAG